MLLHVIKNTKQGLADVSRRWNYNEIKKFTMPQIGTKDIFKDKNATNKVLLLFLGLA